MEQFLLCPTSWVASSSAETPRFIWGVSDRAAMGRGRDLPFQVRLGIKKQLQKQLKIARSEERVCAPLYALLCQELPFRREAEFVILKRRNTSTRLMASFLSIIFLDADRF